MSFAIPAGTNGTNAAATVNGARVLPAGTYTVTLQCGKNGAGSSVTIADADLIVWAAAQ